MKVTDIKINQLVEVEYQVDPDNIEYLPSRIEDMTDEFFYLAVPIRRGEIVPFRIEQNIKVLFSTRSNTYQFQTIIVDRAREPIPVLKVAKPTELIKIQRRSYVRIPVNLEVNFTILPDKVTHRGFTLDISAGGLLLATKTSLKKGQVLVVKIELPQRESVYCHARVIRVSYQATSLLEDNKVAIQFLDISEAQKDRIFNYIFEKQGEWIRRGILE